jgi:signal transduction histidine kinase
MQEGPEPIHGPGVDAPASTERALVRTAALLRVAELLPCPVAMVFGGGFKTSHMVLAIISYTLQVCWSGVFVARSLRTGTLSNRLMLADLTVSSVCLIVSGRSTLASYSASWTNPAVAPAMGTAIAAGVVWWPVRAMLGSGVLVACYLVGVLPAVRLGGPPLTSVVGNVVSLLMFTAVAGTISALMMRHARAIRSTTLAMLADRELAAARQARYDERSRQYRMLHDTVLSTLNSIARGTVDSKRLRERCAADADLIRGMISGDPRALTSLSAELSHVIRDQSALGLRIHSQFGAVPEDLPSGTVAALAGATREALNNVIKHAGTDEAWVTAASHEDGRVLVTVVDRGRGLPRAPVTPGLGLSRSIAARMAEAGGSYVIDSEPGEGTCVELRWPR